MTAPPPAPSVAELGALLRARRFSPTGYYAAAGFLLAAPLAVVLFLVITKPSKDGSDDVFAVGVALFFGTVAALPLWIKGHRKGGTIIEAYERGIRFIPRSRPAATFAYTQVAELRRKDFRGALASLTLVVDDGRSWTIDVQGRDDLALIDDVLARFGNMRWEADRGFRLV